MPFSYFREAEIRHFTEWCKGWETQWEARANGEPGITEFLQGDSRPAATMVGKALLSAIASGDTGGQPRLLEMLGNGFNTVQRYAEAIAFFDRAIENC